VALPSVESIIELPSLLIKKRIANGWTLHLLARKLEMHWQQLQRYEQTDYASANLQVNQRVATVLSAVPDKPKRSKERTASAPPKRSATRRAKLR
jgi:hypothetical protein